MPDGPGAFPLVVFSHGLGGVPETYLAEILPLAGAGFIVAAPVYPTTSTGTPGTIGDVYNGDQSRDASQVITEPHLRGT